MKIFNVEDGVKKVYVQKDDLAMLSHYDGEIPASVYTKLMFGTRDEPNIEDKAEYMLSGLTIIDDSNRMEFIEFSDPREVEFFEKMDWIVDYKELRYLKEDELVECIVNTIQEMNYVAGKYNSLSDEEKEDSISLRLRHELLDFKRHTIPMIRRIQTGEEQIPFPVVPDSDGFSFSSEDVDYIIKGGLDPNKLLLFRKDGKPLAEGEQVPNGFIPMAISIALMERQEKGVFFGNFETSHSFSDDRKYFITEFKVQELEEDKEEMPEDSEETTKEEVKQETGLRRLLNRILGRKQKPTE